MVDNRRTGAVDADDHRAFEVHRLSDELAALRCIRRCNDRQIRDRAVEREVGDVVVRRAATGCHARVRADQADLHVVVRDIRVDLIRRAQRQERAEHL